MKPSFFLYVVIPDFGKRKLKEMGEFPTLAAAETAGLAWIEDTENGSLRFRGCEWTIRCPQTEQEWEFRDGMGFEEA